MAFSAVTRNSGEYLKETLIQQGGELPRRYIAKYQENELIFAEDGEGVEFFIVITGVVGIFKRGSGRDKLLHESRPGAVVWRDCPYQLDAARDLLNNALEINLSIVANRQNAIVKQLTIIATVFLPLTFITGFFGQNFGYLVSRIGSTSSFWALGIGAQVLTLIALLLYFKWKRWF